MKIICVGRNYVEHAKEMNAEKTSKPVIFSKTDSCILNQNKPFYLPQFSDNIHYEAEIVLRVCKLGKYIQPKFAYRYYNAYTIGIDFTARDLQEECKKNSLPWEISKSFDGSACIGEFVETPQEEKLKNLDFELLQNAKIVQKDNTDNMIFNFDEIISYVSQFMTIKIGDLIYTGTPSGVGKVQEKDNLIGRVNGKELLNMKVL